ncbi:hypothetical protein CONPUDRAFT_161658 [Coniophora puteana RWD-64-598 SS2]|uniref:Homeobox domain-containing protein n=1 Tax=Coniophora puteana (strain RWD-64-598) TaxID=741705 RepID=A0A5M3N6H9_CONPW|nr:uncharacterized protein CONPUDRAFT_161658 [Coniophora puteana RWD-64-598 SS2]EIW87042.1 hypothetical protein CONPUDRAFT_161658 [Coniophora puteana RWD-64-598 SS2]
MGTRTEVSLSERRDAQSVMKRVLRSVHSIMDLTANVVKESSHEVLNPPPMPIKLPDPPPLRPHLVQAGAPDQLASKMDHAYFKRALELRSRLQVNLETVWKLYSRTSSSQAAEHILSYFAQTYLKWLASIRKEGLRAYHKYAERIAAFNSRSMPGQRGKVHPFNHEYIPLLEHYFERNPFPSSADRAMLAKKSGMTHRQITVWFQNHRNRAKKEGRLIERKSGDVPAVPLDTLVARMPHLIKPDHLRPQSPNSGTADGEKLIQDLYYSTVTGGPHVFDVPAPSHAFPSSYPPQCSYNPFPSKDGSALFTSPQWFRHTSQVLSNRNSRVVSIDELTERFLQMSVMDVSGEPRRRSQQPDGSAAVAAITVIPPRAPHPALICNSTRSTHRQRFLSLPTVPAPAQGQRVFETPSPQSRPVTLVPQGECPGSPSVLRRKIAPPPKRTPRNASLSRTTTPVGSPYPRRSRTPSCSSGSSRLVSEGSFGSEISNEDIPLPTTPTHPAHTFSPLLPQLEMPLHMDNFFDIPSLLDGSSVNTELQKEFDAILAKANFNHDSFFDFPFGMPEPLLTGPI